MKKTRVLAPIPADKLVTIVGGEPTPEPWRHLPTELPTFGAPPVTLEPSPVPWRQ